MIMENDQTEKLEQNLPENDGYRILQRNLYNSKDCVDQLKKGDHQKDLEPG